jgi:hypothetical protein
VVISSLTTHFAEAEVAQSLEELKAQKIEERTGNWNEIQFLPINQTMRGGPAG